MNITKEILIELYKGKTAKEIADIFGITYDSLVYRLEKFKIKKPNVVKVKKEDLIKLYIEENKSRKEVINVLGISYCSLVYHFKKYKIKKRIRISIKKEDLIKLYVEENKSAKEIGEIFGVSEFSLRHYLHEFKIKKPVKAKKENLVSLYINEKKSSKEMAGILGITASSVKYYLKKFEITKLKDLTLLPPLISLQMELIIGSLLGDGSLCGYRKYPNVNWKFIKSQSKNPIGKPGRREYLDWHFKLLEGYSSSIGLNKNKLKFSFYKGNEKEVESWVYRTHSHPIFTELAKKWYLRDEKGNFVLKNNKIIKIVPNDIKLTPLILAVWMCDDGVNSPKERKALLLTNCFTVKEVEFLVEILRKDLNIESKIQLRNNQPQIYIPAKSYYDFIQIIKPYVIWDCFAYKTDLSQYNPPVYQIGETHRSAKLTNQDINEIFKLDKEGMLRCKIAEKFNISRSAISNILKGKRWKHLGIEPDLISYSFGENNPSSKLTSDNVKEIFKLREKGMFQYDIAEHFNVSQSSIFDVLNKRTWKHVEIDYT